MKSATKILLSLVALLVAPAGFAHAAQAATLYVGSQDPIGDGTSCAQPAFSDPQDAIDVSSEGDTIYLCPEVWPGGYDLEGSTATGDLYFQGAGSGLTEVNGNEALPPNPQLFFDSDPGDIARVHFSDIVFKNGLALDSESPDVDGRGGAIGLGDNQTGSRIFIEDSLFEGNAVQGSGGAVFGKDVTVSGSTFTGNEAGEGSAPLSDNGGAIAAQRSVSVAESTFTNNQSYDFGGAIAAQAIEATTSGFSDNRAGWNGGAIHGSTAVINDSSLAFNIANDDGGAVWADARTCVDYFEVPCPPKPAGLVSEGTIFEGNKTQGNNTNGRGGAIATGQLFLNGGLFDGNRTTAEDAGENDPKLDGGAIYLDGSGFVADSEFTDNSAGEYGGAIAAGDTAANFGIQELTVVDSSFEGNLAGDSPVTDPGVGGGAIAFLGESLTVADSVFDQNGSETVGGGLLAQTRGSSGRARIVGSDFTANDAGTAGGGVTLVQFPEAVVTDTSMSGNSAADGGGALASLLAQVVIDDSTFRENTGGSLIEGEGVQIFGGGAILSVGELFVQGSAFTDNVAAEQGPDPELGAFGGAIASQDIFSFEGIARLAVTESTFSGNEAQVAGGAVFSYSSGAPSPFDASVIIDRSSVADSEGTPVGAGVAALGTSVIQDSTLTGLESPCAPAAWGVLLLVANSTVTGNSGGTAGTDCFFDDTNYGGGALLALGALGVISSTLSGNDTDALLEAFSGDLTGDAFPVFNSIVDHDGIGCLIPEGVTPVGEGNAITTRTTGCDGLVGGSPPSLPEKVSFADLDLSPLAENGGPTETMAIGPESVAIDRAVSDEEGRCGSDFFSGPGPSFDQRGFERPPGECDVGAYEYVTYPLTVTKSGGGRGTVTSIPSGIECGEECAARFGQGTTVTLTAEPAAGSSFVGWSGADCSGTGTCAVEMDDAALVNATFTTTEPGVSISPSTSKVIRIGERARKVDIARVTCLDQTCSIQRANTLFRIGGRVYRATARFSAAEFTAGESRMVSAVVPRRAWTRLKGRRGTAGTRVVAVSSDRTRAQRQVQVRIRR